MNLNQMIEKLPYVDVDKGSACSIPKLMLSDEKTHNSLTDPNR